MSRNLQLQVIMNAVDRVTRPLKKIREGSGKTAEALRASRDQLRNLEAAQKDLKGFRNLKRSSDDTARSLNEQQRRVRDLTQQIRNAEGPTRQLTRQRDAAIRQSRNLKDRYQQEQQQLQTLRGRLRDVHGSTGKLKDQQRQLTERIRTANQQMQAQQKRLEGIAQRHRRAAEAARTHQRSMGNIGRMQGVGAGMLGTGLAKGYMASRLLTPGVAWAEQMSTLQAVGRFSADDERYQALRAQSRDLGGSTAFSATEVGSGQEFLLRAGMSAEAIKASMRDVLDLALANNTELGRAADIASNIAGAFKVDMEVEGAMGRVADILSGTASRANVDLEMLGNTMKYLGGAEDLELTMEQAAAMAGLLGNIGIQGSQAGTTMRAMMNRLTNPAAKGAAAIERIDLAVADANGNMRAMPDILRDISESTKELGNVERKAILQQIFGAEAGSGMAELVNSMSAGQLDELIAALGDSYGENARMASTMADNIGGDLKNLKSAWEEVGISITDTNDGPLRDLVQSITDVMRGIGSWIKANPELAGTIAKSAGYVIMITTALGALTMMMASILGPFAMVRFGLTMLGIKSAGIGTAFMWIGKTAIPAVLGALKMMGAAVLANPILAIVAALAAAAIYVWQNWDTLGPKFAALWEGIKQTLGAAWEGIKAAFSEGIGGVSRLLLDWSPLGLIWRGIAAALSTLGVDVPEGFKSLGGAIIDGLIGGIDEKWEMLKERIGDVAGGVMGWFKEKLGINSPSRVFAEFGVNTMQGYQQGIERSEQGPLREVGTFAKRMRSAGAGLAIGAASLPAIADVPIDSRPPLSAGGGGDINITIGDINVHPAPGMDEQALARFVGAEVKRALAEAAREQAARDRSAFYDND